MASTETRPPVQVRPAPPPPPPPRRRHEKRRHGRRLTPVAVEGLVLFGLAFAAYFVLGHRVVVQQHVVPFDALARLAHASFVWHNDPPKLAAVGFVWPPLSTIAFLPAAAVKPLATSLVALPLTSAAFGAGLVVILNRVLTLATMRRLLRYPLLLAFAANPMIAFYAANGMSEVVYLFFLVFSVYYLLRWFLDRQPRFLVIAGISFSVGILSRYEVIGWAIVLTVVVGAAIIRQHRSRAELEGSLLGYLAPIAYGVGVWLFVNWLILGDALFWLRQQAPGLAAGTVTAPAPGLVPTDPIPVGEILSRLVELNGSLFPLTLAVLVGLAASFVFRNDLMAATLVVLIGLNAAFTGVLVFMTGAEGYFQLRYNMRAIPLAVVGVAWLFLVARGRGQRLAVWAAGLALVVAAVPLAWSTMRTYDFQFLEQAFVRALETGEDQEGKESIGGYRVGVAPERGMASYIETHVRAPSSILTDDSQSFSVMVMTGRPDLFFDRIDRGDDVWLDTLASPWGKVDYLLVSTVALNDLARFRYPGIVEGSTPGFTPVHETERWLLLRVDRRPPRPVGAAAAG